MSTKRKKYSPSEKAKIALEAIKAELTIAQIASKYSAHPTQINVWKKQALACLLNVFSGIFSLDISIHGKDYFLESIF